MKLSDEEKKVSKREGSMSTIVPVVALEVGSTEITPTKIALAIIIYDASDDFSFLNTRLLDFIPLSSSIFQVEKDC